MTILSTAFLVAAAAGAALTETVAPGYPAWDNASDRHYLKGRMITPSDLRHKVVVVVCLKADDTLRSQMMKLAPIVSGKDGVPPGHLAQWDSMEELPRKCLIAVSLSGDPKTMPTTLETALKAPKDEPEDAKSKMHLWRGEGMFAAYYRDLTLHGMEVGARPYVYVMDGKSETPVWKGEYKGGSKQVKEINAAIKKAISELPAWTPLTGVAEPQFYAKEAKKLAEGKPVKPVLKSLQAGIKSKNEDQAKEAQLMFDAVNQYTGDLKSRVMLEFRQCPARAFADLAILLKLCPQEKKNLAMVDLALKQNKDAVSLGKMFAKYVEWTAPNFQFKNASEAKKATVIVGQWKKVLEKLAENQDNPKVQGEASLILAQLDSLPDLLMSKVPQK